MSDAEKVEKPAVGYLRAKFAAGRKAQAQFAAIARSDADPTPPRLSNFRASDARAYACVRLALHWLYPSDAMGRVRNRAEMLQEIVGGEVPIRTIRRWMRDKDEMPAWAALRLADYVRNEAMVGQALVDELNALIAEERARERAAPAFMRVGPDGTNRQGKGRRAKIIRPDDADADK